MRAVCWHCGEETSYRAFAKAEEVVCPDCGEPLFRPLGLAKSVFDALVMVLATGAVWWLEDWLWDLQAWLGLLLLVSVPLGQVLLWPLARRMVYAVCVWHYNVTGSMWGRHDLPCWACGRPAAIYGEHGKWTCPHCGAALFRPVRWVAGAVLAAELLLFGAALFLAYRVAEAWDTPRALLFLMAASVAVFLLDIPGDALRRRMYLRWLERYRSGEAAAPEREEREKT